MATIQVTDDLTVAFYAQTWEASRIHLVFLF